MSEKEHGSQQLELLACSAVIHAYPLMHARRNGAAPTKKT